MPFSSRDLKETAFRWLKDLNLQRTRPFVTALPRRPAKWHRTAEIRVKEREKKKTSSTVLGA